MPPTRKPRPSPSASAASLPVGTRRRGGDGAMWSIAVTSTGIRRWQKTQKKTSPAAKAAPHRLLFCEPYCVRDRKAMQHGVRLTISDKFYPTLLRAPRSLHVRRSTFDIGNAYVFGRRFPLDSYERLGDCGNDGGQIGFIDLDLFDAHAAKSVSETVLTEYGFNKPIKLSSKPLPWENRAALRRVRKQIPHILFMGDTDGGDVGAALYAHRTAGAIDSLIIDNEYYFISAD